MQRRGVRGISDFKTSGINAAIAKKKKRSNCKKNKKKKSDPEKSKAPKEMSLKDEIRAWEKEKKDDMKGTSHFWKTTL